jgi:ribosome-associated heat shock protein Hsp15
MTTEELSPLRLDKWLWAARFFKTRSLAGKLISAGRLRIDGDIMSKPHRQARTGMVLTFPQANAIRVIRIKALTQYRRPAVEAVLLYDDLDPPKPASETKSDTIKAGMIRDPGSGRPTKKDRRAIDRLMR